VPTTFLRLQTVVTNVPRRLQSRRGRSLLAALVLLSATAFFVWFGNASYPVEEWLFFKYLLAWSCVLLFASASMVGGWWLLALITPQPPRWGERLLLAVALGVLAFYSLMFLFGIAQLYSPGTFYALPLILLGLGGPRFLRDVQRILPRLRSFGLAAFRPRNALEILATIFVLVSLLALYMQVLLPRNAHADTHSYHFPIAEHYIAAGGIVRFPEGWYAGAYPQLASILYVWVFLAPGDLYLHVTLCQHLDFALFLVTVAGVSVLAARMLRVRWFPAAAAAMFVFPSLFLYDSNINGDADHILAFWAVPLALALLRLGKRFGAREAVLAGLMTAATALTKYQGIYFVLPALAFALVLAARHRRMLPLMVCLGVAALLTSSHWLKNLVCYHDPMYPILHSYFPSTPFYDGASVPYGTAYWDGRWIVSGSWPHRLWATFKVLGTFSFIPNDYNWHGQRPTFGSLFTLILPLLALLKVPRRLWLLLLGTYLGIGIWYLTSHQDRYLQALLPWMATCVAVILALAHRLGWFARGAAGVLVAVQLTSGLDVYFIPTHIMLEDSPIRAVSDLFSQGYRGNYQRRLSINPTPEKIAGFLNHDTVLLQHTVLDKLGLGVRVVVDGMGSQGAIEYLDHATPNETAALMRSFGVNRAVRYDDPGGVSPAEAGREVVFLRWLGAYGGYERVISEAKLTNLRTLPADRGLAQEPTRIAWLECQGATPRGLYTPRGLAMGQPLQRTAGDALGLDAERFVARANALIIRESCPHSGQWLRTLAGDFSHRMSAGELRIWIRTRRGSPPPQ
jgi:hypothetical protein